MRQTPAGGSQLALREDTGDLHHRHFTHRPTAWLMCRRILCMPWCLPVCGVYMYSMHDSYILMHVWLSHINQLSYGKKLRQCSGMLVCQSCSPVLLGAAALRVSAGCFALAGQLAAPCIHRTFPSPVAVMMWMHTQPLSCIFHGLALQRQCSLLIKQHQARQLLLLPTTADNYPPSPATSSDNCHHAGH